VRASWFSSVFAIILYAGILQAQGPGTRLTYRVRVLERGADSTAAPRVLGGGAVSGSLDTDMRLTLRSDSVEVEALVEIAPSRDTVSLGAEFFTRRRLGRSRRGLPLWEQDTYRRSVRMAWGDTARIDPFGRSRGPIWIELTLERGFAGGEGRPSEQLQLGDSAHDVRVEAVLRPRRARVILNLVRGDTVSGPRGMDLVPGDESRIVQLVRAGRATTLDVRLERPDPPRTIRERVLATESEVVCLRVSAAAATQPIGRVCGTLDNVGRRLPLPTGDTLVATFAWPGPR
jgi:hypothetical protein